VSVERRLRRDPVTGEEREMTDEEYIALILENLDLLYEAELDMKTGRIRLKRRGGT